MWISYIFRNTFKAEKWRKFSVNAIIPEIGLILLPEGSEISYGEDIADKINYYEI